MLLNPLLISSLSRCRRCRCNCRRWCSNSFGGSPCVLLLQLCIIFRREQGRSRTTIFMTMMLLLLLQFLHKEKLIGCQLLYLLSVSVSFTALESVWEHVALTLNLDATLAWLWTLSRMKQVWLVLILIKVLLLWRQLGLDWNTSARLALRLLFDICTLL